MSFLPLRKMTHLCIGGATYTPIRIAVHFSPTAENCGSISYFLAQPSLDTILSEWRNLFLRCDTERVFIQTLNE